MCRGCGGVQEVDGGYARLLSLALRREVGFRTDIAHLAVHGTCGRCLLDVQVRDADAAGTHSGQS